SGSPARHAAGSEHEWNRDVAAARRVAHRDEAADRRCGKAAAGENDRRIAAIERAVTVSVATGPARIELEAVRARDSETGRAGVARGGRRLLRSEVDDA